MSKKTVDAIIKSGNNYVIGVKKNQKRLYHAIEACTKGKKMSWYAHIELNRGRLENREVKVYNLPDEIRNQWAGAKQAVWIHREVKKKGKVSVENAYYLSSMEGSALLYSYGIRSHWSIENSLHWVKDVTMGEDRSKIRKGNAPSILSTLRNGAMNIFRNHGMNQIAKATRLVANDIDKLVQLIK